MSLYKEIINRQTKIAVTGLGYVGMPLAIAFAKKADVIGYDSNSRKISVYLNGQDPTGEVGDEEIRKSKLAFTDDETKLREAKFHIVAVPTPINQSKAPDLHPVESASQTVGRNLTKGSIVVYESTVYPGITENVCIPILEKESGLKCGVDFSVGYSPERINPGDKIHRLENICKIVSGLDKDSLDQIALIYEMVIEAGVYRANSIKVAEAAKVVENSQRDINIAFMNELAMVFDKMNINTNEVIDAMNTKWNALGFRPGLVGGHCIGVDPYYFIYEAERLGYRSQIIAAGRKINDDMGRYIGEAIIKQLILAGKTVLQSRVAIFGITFKENCPDIRNSKVIDIIATLREYGVNPMVADLWADPAEVQKEYGVMLAQPKDIHNIDCAVFAVAHKEYKNMQMDMLRNMYYPLGENQKGILIDIKGIFSKELAENMGLLYWSL